MKSFTARKIVLTALLAGLAYVLMMFRFPLPFMPPFMDFDFAAIPEIIGTFLLGPISGMFIVGIKLLIKIATSGTGSMFTGEIQNFILSCSYILPAWFIYRKNKDQKSAITGMLVGTMVVTIAACLSNIYFIIPFYAKLYGMNMDAIIAMTQAVNPYVNSVGRLVMIGIVPFNLIKFGAASAVMALSLNRLKVVFSRWERSYSV